MDSWNGQGTRINSFALVSYLSDPLASFLDRLRHDFNPDSRARAHLTVLPPRPLVAAPVDAWDELKERLQDVQPFEVELGDVEMFPETSVIYVSIKTGYCELERLHTALNIGQIGFQETLPYHPHITLAQQLPPEAVAAVAETAARRWRAFPHSRTFIIDRLTFVQNTQDNCWTDLAAMDLVSHVAS
jgi:2'-5' RNA ligase